MRGYRDPVVESQRLINRHQAMKTIRPRRADAETEIDFCVRTYRCRHVRCSVYEKPLIHQLAP